MSPPHLASKIPWTSLIEHIQFAPEPTPVEPRRPRLLRDIGKPLPSPIKPDFQVRATSDGATRQTATLDFARAFVSLIVEHADARTSVLPKPDAWHTSGLVDDKHLFPPSLISKILSGHVIKIYSTLRAWSRSHPDEAQLLIIFALNYAENPYEYLPTMLYLAQHPRVSFSKSPFLRPFGSHRLPGLGSYALQTIARYLFVNLIDAMSGLEGTTKRVLGFTQRERAWHVGLAYRDETIADEHLHLPFWISNPHSVYDTAERHRYLERCFHFIVSWYAIMREAAVRDWALGFNEVPAFGENEFLKMVLDELELICSAFKVDAPPPAPAPPAVDETLEVMNYGPSLFTALPVELQMHIISFLPHSALLSIIRVSRQMRTVFTPILYADPLSVVLPPLDPKVQRYSATFDKILQKFMPRLVASLVSNPSTSKFLRCLHVAVPALDCWGAEKASWLKDLLGDVPLQDVRELSVYPTCERRQPNSTDLSPGCEYRHGVYELVRLFPGLATLHIVTMSQRHNIRLDLIEEVQHTRALPPLWTSLRHLTVHLMPEPFYLDVYRRLIAASASTLQSMHIYTTDAQLIEEDEWRRFPVCPNVRELTIYHKSPGLQELLLRCFPKLISLDIYDMGEDDVLDLALCTPRLEHVQFTTICSGTTLPSTIKTILVRQHICYEASGGRLGQPEAAYFGRATSDNIRLAGEAWPWLRSLQIDESADIEELPSLIATHLPHLEILSLFVYKWSDRPRRMDYPVDDGIDEEQRESATRFFEKCLALSVISFNGIPGDDEKGKVPGRVWTRVDGGSGARMTVAGALKWRLSHDWRRSEAVDCRLTQTLVK